MITVEAGADVADDWIAERVTKSDVCVTSDIPLASRCLAKGGRALAPNGKILLQVYGKKDLWERGPDGF